MNLVSIRKSPFSRHSMTGNITFQDNLLHILLNPDPVR